MFMDVCNMHMRVGFNACISVIFMILGNHFRDISYNQITGEIPYNIGFLQVATLLDFFQTYNFINLNSPENSLF
jgi:hypothetical protein